MREGRGLGADWCNLKTQLWTTSLAANGILHLSGWSPVTAGLPSAAKPEWLADRSNRTAEESASVYNRNGSAKTLEAELCRLRPLNSARNGKWRYRSLRGVRAILLRVGWKA